MEATAGALDSPFRYFFFKVASDCNTFVTIWLFIYFSFQSSVGLQYGSTTMNKYKYFSFSTNQRAKFPIFNLNLYIYFFVGKIYIFIYYT